MSESNIILLLINAFPFLVKRFNKKSFVVNLFFFTIYFELSHLFFFFVQVLIIYSASGVKEIT
ncbi:hypothetical protein C8N37_10127 [Sphingobacterium faecium]|nr:hypothetical protein C8N37_10127 [Sphingobacterium faecium]